MNDQTPPTAATPSPEASYDDLHALTGAYAIDAVDDVERARFERHLETCADCRDEVASLQAAATELSHLADLMPPAQLRAKVLSDIAAVRPLPPVVLAKPASPVPAPARRHDGVVTPMRPRRTAPRWLAVAAAVVLVGGGTTFAVNQLSDSPTPQQVLASKVVDDPAAVRHSTSFPGGATAEVVRSTSVGRAVIITKNLPEAPSGRVYQLWLQKGGAFVNAGLMQDAADQVTLLEGDANGAAAVGITDEPAGGSPQPTTAPLALISLA